jgi:hypothetical protein
VTTAALPTTCPACGAIAVASGVCGRCGWASPEGNKCPHCGSVARVEPRGEGKDLRWVCGVCGGPRIPGGRGGPAASTSLREARASLARAARSRASSWVWGLMAAFTTLVLVAAWPAALVAKIILFALAAGPAALAARSRARASKAAAAAGEAEARAWLAAAEDAAKTKPSGITAAELATELRIDPARAEKLLTELAVHDRTRIDVGDDAEVRYSVAPAEAPTARVRVSDPLEEEIAALEEAESKRGEARRSR